MKKMMSLLQSKKAQSAVEYLLIFTVVATVVLVAFRHTFPNVRNTSKVFHDDVADVIRGDNPNTIDGGWCSWGECIGGYERRECMCPQPAFGGAFCGEEDGARAIKSCGDGNTSVCGNGVKEGSEQCDDGNTENNDGCTSRCSFPGPEKGACLGLPKNAYPCPGTEHDMYERALDNSITGPLYLTYAEVSECVVNRVTTDINVRAEDRTTSAGFEVPRCKYISCGGQGSGLVVNGTQSGCTTCGNGTFEAEHEQCDESVEGKNLGCEGCFCDTVRYRPLEAGGCELVCGNGRIDDGEECEAGKGCDVITCQCKNGYVLTENNVCKSNCVVNPSSPECLEPAPTCLDNVQNGDEEGVDCGGSDCVACCIEDGEDYVRECTADNQHAQDQGLEVNNNSKWAFCDAGDTFVRCDDTGSGSNHGIDEVGVVYGGRAGCKTWEGSNNRGGDACQLFCSPAPKCNGNDAQYRGPK